MKFDLIDMEHWERKAHYDHYINHVVCTYSMTVNVDITSLKGKKLYPAMLWLLTDTVNEMREFRTSLAPEGVGIFENMHPSYTIFNQEKKLFSVIWTEFDKDYTVFLSRYERDCEIYSAASEFAPKQHKPMNTFDVSMIPWTTFSSFHLNIAGGGQHLLPIFTMGRFFTEENKTMLPIAVQVHHAVCDGYHVGMFFDKLQNKIAEFQLPKVQNETESKH